MRITSLQNPRIKEIARLRSDARQRRKVGLTLVEGWDEIAIALAAGHQPKLLVSSEESPRPPVPAPEIEVLEVSEPVFQKLSIRDNPDGWLALFPQPALALEDLRFRGVPFVVVVEAVEKPGNLGAILRTCDAAGVDAVISCDPHTDMFGPNVVRASRGTVFSVPAVAVEGAEAFAFLRARAIKIVAATPAASADYTAQDLRGPLAIAVGSEDAGLSDAWLQRADVRVKIPMWGRVNSLNVSVAAALIIYEALRQRTG